MELTKDNIMDATMKRIIDGDSYKEIANQFGVSDRTERRWRQLGKYHYNDGIEITKSLYCRYYVSMKIADSINRRVNDEQKL